MTAVLIYTTIFAFAFGAAIGSFLNVVIYRVPEGISLISPSSRCPSCKSPIAFYDNIPVFSWFLLRGRCRNCKTRISFRYALVELLTGALSAGVWYKHFAPMAELAADPLEIRWAWAVIPWAFHFVFCAFLVAITFVDLDTCEIPHEFTIPAMVLGLAAPWVYEYGLSPQHIFVFWPPVTQWTSVIGFFAGGLAVLLIYYGYLSVRNVEGLGGGDVTMMAMVGAWLGWPSLPFVFFAASLQGVLAAGATSLLGIGFVRDSGQIFREEDPDATKTQQDETVFDETQDGDETPDDVEKSLEGSGGETFQGEADSRDEHVDEELDYEETGFGAVPFGPFIAAAAVEFLLFGDLLPPEFSMLYLYY